MLLIRYGMTPLKPLGREPGLLIAVGLALFFYFRSPPQMGTSEEVFHTVDALFTAAAAGDALL